MKKSQKILLYYDRMIIINYKTLFNETSNVTCKCRNVIDEISDI